MRFALLVIGLGLVGFAAWVRLAPTDVRRWHVALDFDQPSDQQGGAQRAVAGDAAALARLDEIALATDRTRVLAGSAAEGHVTYMTRSALWGFPDFTTVQLVEGQVRLWGRLRFGRSDLGVNRKRIEGWLKALGQA